MVSFHADSETYPEGPQIYRAHQLQSDAKFLTDADPKIMAIKI